MGLELAHSSIGYLTCQGKYVLDILYDLGFLGCKPTQTPTEHNINLSATAGPLLDDPPFTDSLLVVFCI